jgi:hypothetical protein
VVIRQLPITVAKVQAFVKSVGFVVDKVVLVKFSLSTSVSPATNSSDFSILIIYHSGQIVANVLSALSLISPQETKKK